MRRPWRGGETTVTREELARALQLLAEANAAPPPAPVAPSGRAWPHLLVVLATALMLVGGAAFLGGSSLGAASASVHHHVTFAIYLDNARVVPLGAAFDLATRGDARGHLHQPHHELLHIEGAPTTFADALRRAAGIELRPDGVAVDEALGGRMLETNATTPLRGYAQHGDAPWREIAVTAHVPRDGERVLVILGSPAEQDLAEARASVPTLAELVARGASVG